MSGITHSTIRRDGYNTERANFARPRVDFCNVMLPEGSCHKHLLGCLVLWSRSRLCQTVRRFFSSASAEPGPDSPRRLVSLRPGARLASGNDFDSLVGRSFPGIFAVQALR